MRFGRKFAATADRRSYRDRSHAQRIAFRIAAALPISDCATYHPPNGRGGRLTGWPANSLNGGKRNAREEVMSDGLSLELRRMRGLALPRRVAKDTHAHHHVIVRSRRAACGFHRTADRHEVGEELGQQIVIDNRSGANPIVARSSREGQARRLRCCSRSTHDGDEPFLTQPGLDPSRFHPDQLSQRSQKADANIKVAQSTLKACRHREGQANTFQIGVRTPRRRSRRASQSLANTTGDGRTAAAPRRSPGFSPATSARPRA